MNLLETRKPFNISQKDVSSFLGVPLRTYIRYEQDNSYGNSLKREMMINSLKNKYEITEDGLLGAEFIQKKINRYI